MIGASLSKPTLAIQILVVCKSMYTYVEAPLPTRMLFQFLHTVIDQGQRAQWPCRTVCLCKQVAWMTDSLLNQGSQVREVILLMQLCKVLTHMTLKLETPAVLNQSN